MTVESLRSLWKREIGSFCAKCWNMAFASPRLPSAFSKSIGLILWGIVDEPISPLMFFCLKYPKDIYDHISLLKSSRMVLVRHMARES